MCGSKYDYIDCCGAYLQNKKQPKNPEDLMRSRYTAYCLADIDYIKKTMRGKAKVGFNDEDAKLWAKRVKWIKLLVIESCMENPHKGFVEFIATFIDGNTVKSIHEKSEFTQTERRWYYVDGVQLPSKSNSIARNSICPCGSNKKYKNCHAKN